MRVIVVGAGQVGTYVARTLAFEGHDVVLIELDPDLAASVDGTIDAMVINGSGVSPTVLRQAEADRAQMLVAVTDSDEANIIACLSVQQLAETVTTVARVRNPDYFETGSSATEGILGIDYVIHPDRVTADDLSEALLLPGAVNVEHFAGNRVSVAEVILRDGSPLLGGALADRRRTPNYLVGATSRDGEPQIVYDETEVLANDRIILSAPRKGLREVVAKVAGSVEQVRHAIILGGTSIGIQLARRLRARGINVKIVESDMVVAERIAAMLDNVLVLHSDGLSREFLLQEGVADVHAFVACTADDATNMFAALNAKKLGAHMTLTVTERSEFLPLVENMAIDAAVSPRLHTAAAILRFVRKGRVIRLRQFESGAELIELQAEANSAIVGTQLRDGDWPKSAVVAAVVRDDEVILPTGSTVIEAGDSVVIFTLARSISAVERHFAG